MFYANRFFPPALLTVPRPTKRSYGRLLNVSNNELRHPRLDAVVASFYASAEISWVTRYPYWPGVLALIARQFGLPTDWVWISAGSDQAIRTLIRLAAMAGNRMILEWPNYATYATTAVGEGMAIEKVPSVWCSVEEELDSLCAAARRPGQALVVVTNPHAFTGRLLALDAIAALASACEREGHLLMIDEAYVWFAESDHLPLLEQFPNLLLLRSFSKGFGMAGLRFAAILGRPGVLDYLARTRCMAEVSGPAAAFVEHCLTQWPVLIDIWHDIARYRDETAEVVESLNGQWSCPSSSANFQLVDTGTAERAERVTLELERQGIAVRSLAGEPTLASCFRYTVCGDSSTGRLLEALGEITTAL